ncbi:MAG: ATP-binding cassette domain-containing protein, partial [Prosthecobacter sp.]
MALLEVRNLTKRWRKDQLALDDVSFDLRQGEILGLLGHNGAGKSTLLKCIAGLDKPDTGATAIAAETEAIEKKKDLGDVLVNQGKISDDDFRRMQSHILGIPFVDLKHQKLEFEVLSLIPEPIARNHNIVAFSKKSEGKE